MTVELGAVTFEEEENPDAASGTAGAPISGVAMEEIATEFLLPGG